MNLGTNPSHCPKAPQATKPAARRASTSTFFTAMYTRGSLPNRAKAAETLSNHSIIG